MIVVIAINSHLGISQTEDIKVKQFWRYISLSFSQQTMPDMGRSLLFSTSQKLYPSFSTAISKIETISNNYSLQDYILLELYERFGNGEFAKLLFADMFGCSQSLSNFMIGYMDKKYKNDKRYINWYIEKKFREAKQKSKDEDDEKTKNTNLKQSLLSDSIEAFLGKELYVSTQTMAEYPGGPASWTKYIQRSINSWGDTYNDSLNATNLAIEVEFIVLPDGKIDSITVDGTNDKKLINKIIILFKTSEKWKPAIQDGNFVFERKRQKIGFKGTTLD